MIFGKIDLPDLSHGIDSKVFHKFGETFVADADVFFLNIVLLVRFEERLVPKGVCSLCERVSFW